VGLLIRDSLEDDMMPNEARTAELLSEVAQTHHRVYQFSDGADPDWASWYADWLIRRSPFAELFGRTPVPSELVWLLVELDRRYTVERPDDPWEGSMPRPSSRGSVVRATTCRSDRMTMTGSGCATCSRWPRTHGPSSTPISTMGGCWSPSGDQT
jgi:hypothetical protein